jgi:2-(1,2-epoxy-1,2-dihydrophenyl)acetyl-CoA isomerase
MAEEPSPTLQQEMDGAVAWLTLDRPSALNAFDRQLKVELLDALTAVGRDREVRAIVITGAGRAFSAGQDLRERTSSFGRELREHYHPIILAIRHLDKPVIAAVNGVAAGAGASIAFACDIRIAAEEAAFVLAFGRVGLAPDSGASWFLPRLVGPSLAAELIMTGEPLTAMDALRFGLVSRVVPADHLRETTAELASTLADGAPRAIALAKRALARSATVDLAAALEYEAHLQEIAGHTRDHAEGVAAFIEKRRPRFSGN